MQFFNCKTHGNVKPHSSGNHPRCSVCNNERMRIKHQELRTKAIEYGGGKCQICGYNRCDAALDFHHKDPSKKDIMISRAYKRTWESVKAEIDKCILVCSNCHREIHSGFLVTYTHSPG